MLEKGAVDTQHTVSCPIVTVCVAIYNVKPYLRECLENLMSQTLKDVEVLLIDDGSTDGSGSLCDEFVHMDARFHVIHQANQGTLLARKTGILRARGKYLVFLDGDDRYAEPRSLETIVSAIEREQVDILRFDVQCFGDDPEKVIAVQSWINKFDADDIPQNTLSWWKNLSKNAGWALWLRIFRTSVCQKAVRYWPDVYLVSAEDCFALCTFVFFATFSKNIHTDPVYLYRIGSGISTSDIGIAQFTQIVQGIHIVSWLESMLRAENASPEYFEPLSDLRKQVLGFVCSRLQKLPLKDRGRGLKLLASENRAADLVDDKAFLCRELVKSILGHKIVRYLRSVKNHLLNFRAFIKDNCHRKY